MSNFKNLFITVEGIDGSGKSTQAKLIAKWLQEFSGIETVNTFEPGDWSGGKKLRDLILHDDNFNDFSELFLFLADRAGHLKNLILPALNSGKNIICERYNDSSLAYQSGGNGLNFIQVKNIINACNFPTPDLTVFLDINPDLAFKRIKIRNPDFFDDKFEARGLNLMRKVSDFYNIIADENPNRFIKISVPENYNQSMIFENIKLKLEEKFGLYSS